MANTPGGGSLILGISDDGRVPGTELDVEWLRHRIFERVEIAPHIEERQVRGARILALYVAEAREPVEDPDRKVRWRVAANCVPVDRSEWWLRRQERDGLDLMAAATGRTTADVDPVGLAVARRYLADGGDLDISEVGTEELLRRVGALRPDGRLTQAGVLLFCPANGALLTFARFDVAGGEVLATSRDVPGMCLLEQLAAVEDRLDVLNAVRPVPRGFVEVPIRQLPERAVREAILNGLMHRDWMRAEPVSVTWYEQDSTLDVVSPGGFTGGVSALNVLTQRHARYPALSDLFRALRLVDKQGVGVDRMYRDMIVIGHRPPRIVEEPGPRVRTRLVGGDPVIPVMALVNAIIPPSRRCDVRIALITYELLHQPFLNVDSCASALQTTAQDARDALEATAKIRVHEAGHSGRHGPATLIEPYKDVWVFSGAALARVEQAGEPLETLHRRGLITYRKPSPDRSREIVESWLSGHDQITSGDYATLTRMSQAWALKCLDRLVGDLLRRGDTSVGRHAHFRLVRDS